ncbi:hypothetical protein VTN77DRAFT_2936 [Rasamsonia byssochlamydoides]|uniref:uncharacterized protein n=1 Tax=Rasamsonia byssochlamydoides TaxID=89139 RepID=UPI0037422844
MLGYFIKYLDQQNYSNAFVSGMQEDLHLYGNERNLLVTYFNIGLIIGTVPSQLIQLKYVRPSIWIPTCELLWSVLVMAMGGAKNIQTLYALRFFVGLLESCSFPGYAALLGSWYGPNQLGKRVALFEQASAIAGMFSGYLQAGLYQGMNGKGGLAGWKWLFIFDGVISIPIAVWGYFAIPDLPSNTRAFYFSEKDRQYGIERIQRMGRASPKKLTWPRLKQIYTSWHMWAFIFAYVMVAEAGSGSDYFNLWLKAEKYHVVLVNTIPSAGNAISVVSSLFFGTVADRTGRRSETAIVVCVLVIVANITLSVWYIGKGALFFAFFLSYTSAAAQPIIIAWGHEITQHNAELRQLLVATGNIFTYTCSAWLPVVLFPTYDAPHYKYAYQVLILFGGLSILGILLLKYLRERELKTNPESGLVAVGDGGHEHERP